MKVSDLGEFGLIDLIAGIVGKTGKTRQLLIGIGDDAAAWQGDKAIQLATTDSLVQDIHFDPHAINWEDLGWKSLAVNLSDIAAMGGVPKYALVSLALPGDLEVARISALYQGMLQVANQFSVIIAGGNIASADKVVITITVSGSLKGKHPLTRTSALPGDQVALTGYTGLSAAGLRMLKQNLHFDAETTDLFLQAHLRPMPSVKEGQTLLQRGVRTAIDISDGLIADLTHVCQASHVGARINADLVPIHPALKAAFPADYRQLALGGGEDYELLFTASSQVVSRVQQALNCPVTVIGNITREMPGQVTVTDATGNILPWQQGGWEHFKSRP